MSDGEPDGFDDSDGVELGCVEGGVELDGILDGEAEGTPDIDGLEVG